MKNKLVLILIFIISLTVTIFTISCGEPENAEPPKVDSSLEIYNYQIIGEEIILEGYKDLNYIYIYDELFIPACVTKIADEAFINYNMLKVTFEENSKLKTIGNKAFYNCVCLTDIKFPTSVKTIGDNAFNNCLNLTEITIPSTIENLGENLFDGCHALTIYCDIEEKPNTWSDNFNSSNNPIVWDCNNNDIASNGRIYKTIDGIRYSLQGNEAFVERQPYFIKTANVTQTANYNGKTYTVTKICDKAFYECQNLTYATIPTTVKNIGEEAFSKCSLLLEVNYLGSIDEWASNIVFDGPVLQNGLGLRINDKIVTEAKLTTATKISKNAFSENYRLISLEIPKSVTVIEEGAFTNCYNLILYCKASEKPQGWAQNLGAKSIIWNSDENDTALDGKIYTKINEVNYEIYNDEARVYFQDENITSLTIPTQIVYKNKTYKVVGTTQNSIFWTLYNLKDIIYEGSIDEWVSLDINESPFYYVENFYVNGEVVTEITISSNANLSYYGSFGYYRKLTKVVFSEGLSFVSGSMFIGCENLKEVILPSTLTYIDVSAFEMCTNLEKIVIPASVKVISTSAFSHCYSLEEVIIEENSELTDIARDAFKTCTKLIKFTIPSTVINMGESVFNHDVIIYCEIKKEEIPPTWNKNWNLSNNPVIWDYKNNEIASDGYVYTIYNDCSYKILDGVATFIRPNFIPTNLEIPESITYKGVVYPVTIIERVTQDWNSRFSLISVVIPNSVKEISSSAFYSCENLETVTFSPNSTLEIIGKASFCGCKNLTKIFIPKSVTKIMDDTFWECKNLTIYCEIEEKPTTWQYRWAYYDSFNECTVVWGYKG